MPTSRATSERRAAGWLSAARNPSRVARTAAGPRDGVRSGTAGPVAGGMAGWPFGSGGREPRGHRRGALRVGPKRPPTPLSDTRSESGQRNDQALRRWAVRLAGAAAFLAEPVFLAEPA